MAFPCSRPAPRFGRAYRTDSGSLSTIFSTVFPACHRIVPGIPAGRIADVAGMAIQFSGPCFPRQRVANLCGFRNLGNSLSSRFRATFAASPLTAASSYPQSCST